MNSVSNQLVRELLENDSYPPCVSILLPFQVKVNPEVELALSLKSVFSQAEKILKENYPDEVVSRIMFNLRNLVPDIKPDLRKKSIALFASLVYTKVVFLDVPVEEHIFVGENYEVRDLIYSRKELDKFLVLLISSKQSKLMLGDSTTLIKLNAGLPESIHETIWDIANRMVNYSDSAKKKEVVLHKYLHKIDDALEPILSNVNFPVFVVGTERVLGHFDKLTRHGQSVVSFIRGNFEEATPHQLNEIIQPYLQEWKAKKQQQLLAMLDAAAGQKKLSCGIRDVWREAEKKNSRLLVVEKNYMISAEHGATPDVIFPTEAPLHQVMPIQDAVDDVIEKVVQSGGDVEFVDPGLLKHCNHIALVQYY